MEPNSNKQPGTFTTGRAIALATLAMPFLYLIYINFVYKGVVVAEPTLQAAVPPPTAATYDKLIPLLTQATVDSPSYDTYFNLGLTLYQAQRFEESIVAFNKAIGYNDTKAVAWNNLAAAYGSLNKWPEEIEACKRALALDPGMVLAKNNLAWAKAQLAKTGQ